MSVQPPDHGPGDVADVRFEHVTKRFGAAVAVRDLSLSIPRGSFFSLLGPSGCGKTTTLRLIAGFERPDRGEVFIRDVRVTDTAPYRRDFAMVFQNFALFPHLSVADNVAFGLKMRRIARAERDRAVADALALVKLEAFADRFPRQLSGGQQQRVAIARAIVVKPAVLLLDEPLGALDKNLREAMQVELRALQRSLGVTAVFVTHDQEEALTMSDRIAVMRDGVIEQIGPPRDVYERPATEFVATFLGASNLFDATVIGRDHKGAMVDAAPGRFHVVDAGYRNGQTLRLAVRPERLRIGLKEDGEGIPATIREIVYRGSVTHLLLDSAGRPLTVFLQNVDAAGGTLAPGDTITCTFETESAVVLAGEAVA